MNNKILVIFQCEKWLLPVYWVVFFWKLTFFMLLVKNNDSIENKPRLQFEVFFFSEDEKTFESSGALIKPILKTQ